MVLMKHRNKATGLSVIIISIIMPLFCLVDPRAVVE
jgi:hypothetical protein